MRLQLPRVPQVLDQALPFAPDFKKSECRGMKKGKDVSFGCSVSPDQNWVIKEQLFQPFYLITKRNLSLKIKLQVPALY